MCHDCFDIVLKYDGCGEGGGSVGRNLICVCEPLNDGVKGDWDGNQFLDFFCGRWRKGWEHEDREKVKRRKRSESPNGIHCRCDGE